MKIIIKLIEIEIIEKVKVNKFIVAMHTECSNFIRIMNRLNI